MLTPAEFINTIINSTGVNKIFFLLLIWLRFLYLSVKWVSLLLLDNKIVFLQLTISDEYTSTYFPIECYMIALIIWLWTKQTSVLLISVRKLCVDHFPVNLNGVENEYTNTSSLYISTYIYYIYMYVIYTNKSNPE